MYRPKTAFDTTDNARDTLAHEDVDAREFACITSDAIPRLLATSVAGCHLSPQGGTRHPALRCSNKGAPETTEYFRETARIECQYFATVLRTVLSLDFFGALAAGTAAANFQAVSFVTVTSVHRDFEFGRLVNANTGENIRVSGHNLRVALKPKSFLNRMCAARPAMPAEPSRRCPNFARPWLGGLL